MVNLKSQMIKNKTVVDDDWTVLRLKDGETADNIKVDAGKIIVPL